VIVASAVLMAWLSLRGVTYDDARPGRENG
jgi:hypothetical protein